MNDDSGFVFTTMDDEVVEVQVPFDAVRITAYVEAELKVNVGAVAELELPPPKFQLNEVADALVLVKLT